MGDLQDNLSDLYYVNLSGATSSGICPLSSDINICDTCQEKCNFSCSTAAFQASCFVFEGGLCYSNVTTNSNNPFIFNENTYNVVAMYLLTPSINTYSTTSTYCDFVVETISGDGFLVIYVPVSIGSSTNISIPSTISASPVAISNVQVSNYIPSQMPFYVFTAPYKNNNKANYIIFPASSCNNSISDTIYNDICSAGAKCGAVNPIANPSNNYLESSYYTKYGYPITYNSSGANSATATSDNIYIQCKPTDYTPATTTSNKPYTQEPKSLNQNPFLFYLIVGVVVILAVTLIFRILLLLVPSQRKIERLKTAQQF